MSTIALDLQFSKRSLAGRDSQQGRGWGLSQENQLVPATIPQQPYSPLISSQTWILVFSLKRTPGLSFLIWK